MTIDREKLLDTLNQLMPSEAETVSNARALGYKQALEEVIERVRSGTVDEDEELEAPVAEAPAETPAASAEGTAAPEANAEETTAK